MSWQALGKQKLEKLQQIFSMRILANQVMFVQTVLAWENIAPVVHRRKVRLEPDSCIQKQRSGD